jgi:hypothetical protein
MMEELMHRIKRKPEIHSGSDQILTIPSQNIETIQKHISRNTRVFSRKRKDKNPNNSGDFKSAKKAKKSKVSKKDSVRSELPLRFLKQSVGTRKSREKRDDRTQLSHRQARLKSREESITYAPHSPRSKLQEKSLSRIHAGLTPASNYSMNQMKKTKRDEIPKKLSAEKRPVKQNKTGTGQGCSDSRPKLKIDSFYLGNAKKDRQSTQAKSTERIKHESSTDRLQIVPEGMRSNKLVRLTLNTCKSSMPLVQINNIVGDIKESSQINRSSNFTSRTETAIYRPAKEQFRSSDSRARSRKSPSTEIAMESERTRISSILKKNQAYDKKLIANYLQRNRLVNL